MQQTRLVLDSDAKTVIADTWQDVEPILDHNKMLRGQPQKSDWGRHIASIPNVIMLRWLNEEYARGNVGLRMYSKEFDEIVAKKLRDPDWKFLRVDR